MFSIFINKYGSDTKKELIGFKIMQMWLLNDTILQ